MKVDKRWGIQGFTMRLVEQNDKDGYYEGMFTNVDVETIRMTGSKDKYSKEEVDAYFDRIVMDSDRFDFIIVADDGTIVGESVLNDIDKEVGSANFRVGIANRDYFGKGLGSWAIKNTLEYGFEVLKLNRIELDVFSFNERAIHTYKKAGFVVEGVRRQAVKDGDVFADDILMSILASEWNR